MQASKPVRGFSADTEILTRDRSWQRFDQISTADEVAIRTPDGEFQWAHPERVVWQPYSGDMVWGHSRSADLMVTPGTMFLAHKRERFSRNNRSCYGEYKEYLRDAGYFIGTQEAHLVATSRWEPARRPREIHLKPTIVRTGSRLPFSFTASSEDFAAFMGMYLAEGCLGYTNRSGAYPINIWQSEVGNGFHEYGQRLNAMIGHPIPWMKKGFFVFNNKALFEYLKPLGGHAWEKVIPPEILEMTAPDLEVFWDYFCLGDGNQSYNPSGKEIRLACTTSPWLVDGLQEVLQKLGSWAIRRYSMPNRGPAPSGHQSKRRICYRLTRRGTSIASATTVDRVPYDGFIGSVAVPADVVYVRRGDHPIWAGSA